MQFELALKPSEAADRFPDEALHAMHRYLATLPAHRWDDGTYSVFPSEEARVHQVLYLLEDPARRGYLEADVVIGPDEVALSIIQDERINALLHGFVTWVQARWPSQLYEWDEPADPSVLLGEY